MKKVFLLFFLIFVSNLVLAHEAVESQVVFLNPVETLIIASAVIILTAIISVVGRKYFTDTLRKISFAIILIASVAATAIVIYDTVIVNITSVTGGPVHWHADLEIWICGEIQVLPGPESILENRVGSAVFHHHNEGAEEATKGIYRIHIEGPVRKLEDVNLHEFFEVIGGIFEKDRIGIPQHHSGMKIWKNGDLCPNGKAGTLKMFVNDELNEVMDEYVIKRYTTVPPGDRIKIVFGD